jgi:integrase/recombinase XerD
MKAPSVKQRLADIRMLFDWLVGGQVVAVNPAHCVRGPRHSVSKGAMPVLSPKGASALLAGMNASTLVGLRDRAIIAVMTYTFARGRGRSTERRGLLRPEKTLVAAPQREERQAP